MYNASMHYPYFHRNFRKKLGVNVVAGSSVFMDVMQILTNPTLAAFIACAVLMAILSTAISLLNAVSSNLSQDFDLDAMKGLQGLQFSRRITAGIGVLAVGGSFYMGEIVDLLIQSYELSVYCLFVPVFLALFKSKGHTLSAWLAFIFGCIGFCLTRFIFFGIPKEVIGLLISAIGYVLGECWIRWQELSTIKEFHPNSEK